MPELTPESIRKVQFREKLRGYHPEDVDTFVADVAATVESLQRQLAEASTAAPAAAAVASPTSDEATTTADVEESLRRTLILAQRTADMAVKEAQEEAARLVGEAEARRASIDAEADETRSRTMAALEHELSGYRQRLYDERDALQRDVAALQAYVAQERERLRIYFSQQLEQLEGGVPTIGVPPQTEAPQREEQESVVVDAPGLPERSADPDAGVDTGVPGGEGEGVAADATGDEAATDDHDDDPFLAELRRAATDTEPLGPRDDEPPLPPKDERDLDIFNDDDGGGRFLRRRR